MCLWRWECSDGASCLVVADAVVWLLLIRSGQGSSAGGVLTWFQQTCWRAQLSTRRRKVPKHQRFKRTLFNRTKQDRKRIFEEIFFKAIHTLQKQTNHLSFLSWILPEVFEKEDFLENSHPVLFCSDWKRSFLWTFCVFWDLFSEHRQSTVSDCFNSERKWMCS